MTKADLLYCVGATKAGTTWFYRALHGHPDCALSSIKELHYWDSFDEAARARQADVLRARITGFRAQRAEARAAGGRAWQVANLERRIAEMDSLAEVIEGDRTDDRAYLDWLAARRGDKALTADMTPGYGMLPVEVLARMAEAAPGSRFVLLIRDPLSRIWSHVRMQAERQKQPDEILADKANSILWRILNRSQEKHVLLRGDYPAMVERLRAAVPAERLRVEYSERLYTEAGQRDMASFLGIGYHPADGADRAHEGPKARIRKELAVEAIGFLKEHYDWAARTMGPLPQKWQDNLALAR